MTERQVLGSDKARTADAMGDLLYCRGNAEFRVQEVQKELRIATDNEELAVLTAEVEVQQKVLDMIVKSMKNLEDHICFRLKFYHADLM